ncbi:hypothetical protein P9112_014145 [Eukaryota sp. TZLM1-RC]
MNRSNDFHSRKRAGVLLIGSREDLQSIQTVSNFSRRFFLKRYYNSLQPKIRSFYQSCNKSLDPIQNLDLLYNSLTDEERSLYARVEAVRTITIPFSEIDSMESFVKTPDVVSAIETYMLGEGTSDFSSRDPDGKPCVQVFSRLHRALSLLRKDQPEIFESDLCFLATINALSVKAVLKRYTKSVLIDIGGAADKNISFLETAHQECKEELALSSLPPSWFDKKSQRALRQLQNLKRIPLWKMVNFNYRSYFSLVDNFSMEYEVKIASD